MLTTSRTADPLVDGAVPPALVLAFLLTFLVTQWPSYAVRYPGIVDLPNHVARLHVAGAIEASALLQGFYVAAPGIAPNLAMDLLVPPMAAVVGLELAVKIFASIASLFAASAVPALSLALHGRVTPIALGGLLFAHNAFFQLGLFNFVLGVGAALWLLAAWIRVSRGGTPPRLLLPAFAAAATLVYLCHLAAFGVYLLGVLAVGSPRPGMSVLRGWVRTGLAVGLQALPAFCLHVLFYRPGSNLPHAFPATDLASLAAYKAALALLLPRVVFHSEPLLAAAVAGPCAFLLYRAWRLGRLAWSSTGGRAVLALAVAMLLLPPLGFGSNMVDLRLALPMALLACASLSPRGGADGRVWIVAAATGALLLTVGSWHAWSRASDEQAALRQAMLAIEPGSRVAVVSLDEPAHAGSRSPSTRPSPAITPHAAAWSVVDRSTMLSSLFIRPFQPFPVAFRPEFVGLARLARLDNDAPPPALASLRGHFDYVVVFGTEGARHAFGEGDRIVQRAAGVAILKP